MSKNSGLKPDRKPQDPGNISRSDREVGVVPK